MEITNPNGFTRLRSIRSSRRMLEEVLHQHLAGTVSATSLTAVTGAVKVWTELFLAEQELMQLGLDMEREGHPLGEDGGYVPGALVPSPAMLTISDEGVALDDATGAPVKRTRKAQGFVLPSSFEE